MRSPSLWPKDIGELQSSPSTLHRLVRWLIAGIGSMAIGLPLLYVLISILRMGVPAATLLGGELGLLLRYLVNDRWVFRESARSWRRLWQFHVAAAAGFVVWWLVTNILARAGVHYLIAAVCGTAASACCSVVTNFLWVWRSAGASSTDALAHDPKHGGS